MTYSLDQLAGGGVPSLLAGVSSESEWEVKRARILKTWTECVGYVPPRMPPRYETISEEVGEAYSRQSIIYDTVHGDRVPAELLIPHSAHRTRPFRRPAVLALHPTVNTGKADVALSTGRDNRRYGHELAMRGYVVLAPDALTAGDRIYPGHGSFETAPFYAQHPDWSTAGKNITDHAQGLDVLCTLDCVDPERLGTIGHSFGAYNGYFLAGYDARVKAVVASCGIGPFTGNPHAEMWGLRPEWYTHFPRVSQYLDNGEVPFEFNEIIALCPPTPLFLYSGQTDQIFPHWEAVAAVTLDVHRLYEWLDISKHYVSLMSTGGHDFPAHIREAAYRFLDQWLEHTPNEGSRV